MAAGHRCVADLYVREEARRNPTIHRPNAMGDLDDLIRRIEYHRRYTAAEIDTEAVDLS